MYTKIMIATIDLTVFSFSRLTWRIQANQAAKKLGRKNQPPAKELRLRQSSIASFQLGQE
jgi:hypothetical protein